MKKITLHFVDHDFALNCYEAISDARQMEDKEGFHRHLCTMLAAACRVDVEGHRGKRLRAAEVETEREKVLEQAVQHFSSREFERAFIDAGDLGILSIWRRGVNSRWDHSWHMIVPVTDLDALIEPAPVEVEEE